MAEGQATSAMDAKKEEENSEMVKIRIDKASLQVSKSLQLRRPGYLSLLQQKSRSEKALNNQMAIMLNIALKMFARANRKVLILCRRKAVYQRTRNVAQYLDHDDEAFKLVYMKYLNNSEELIKYLAQIHHYEAPSLIIMEDLASFFKSVSENSHKNHVKTVALLKNAVEWANMIVKRKGDEIGSRAIVCDQESTGYRCDLSGFYDIKADFPKL